MGLAVVDQHPLRSSWSAGSPGCLALVSELAQDREQFHGHYERGCDGALLVPMLLGLLPADTPAIGAGRQEAKTGLVQLVDTAGALVHTHMFGVKSSWFLVESLVSLSAPKNCLNKLKEFGTHSHVCPSSSWMPQRPHRHHLRSSPVGQDSSTWLAQAADSLRTRPAHSLKRQNARACFTPCWARCCGSISQHTQHAQRAHM